MSIGFVVGAMVICGILGLETLAKLFGAILLIGLTIFHPWLLIVWGGILYLATSSKN